MEPSTLSALSLIVSVVMTVPFHQALDADRQAVHDQNRDELVSQTL
jgi:hypothetical protein